MADQPADRLIREAQNRRRDLAGIGISDIYRFTHRCEEEDFLESGRHEQMSNAHTDSLKRQAMVVITPCLFVTRERTQARTPYS